MSAHAGECEFRLVLAEEYARKLEARRRAVDCQEQKKNIITLDEQNQCAINAGSEFRFVEPRRWRRDAADRLSKGRRRA